MVRKWSVTLTVECLIALCMAAEFPELGSAPTAAGRHHRDIREGSRIQSGARVTNHLQQQVSAAPCISLARM